MLEEIKKEIEKQKEKDNKLLSRHYLQDFIFIPDMLKILDNQPDYKSAFDEIFEKSHYKNITMEDMIDFSKKYNLGGE